MSVTRFYVKVYSPRNDLLREYGFRTVSAAMDYLEAVYKGWPGVTAVVVV